MSKKFDIRELKKPFVIMLIGVPLSGKTTWIKNNIPKDFPITIISRDDIIMEVGKGDNYNEAYESIDEEGEKEVNKILRERIINANSKRENVIIDMTNMSSKRRNTLNHFKKEYNRIGILFPFLSKEEYEKRNEKRKSEESKYIPYSVIRSMIDNYKTIDKDDRFNELITISKV